jgi:hypothetical protein
MRLLGNCEGLPLWRLLRELVGGGRGGAMQGPPAKGNLSGGQCNIGNFPKGAGIPLGFLHFKTTL